MGEHRLWVFENRALRNIFGYKKKVVTGEWRRLQNKELLDLFCSSIFFLAQQSSNGPGPPYLQGF